jgi:taurine dioxygenase
VGKHLGAEVSGVDLTRPLDEGQVSELRAALLQHLVIFFRDQEMSYDDLAALGRRFGRLYTTPRSPAPPGHPELVLLHADEKTERVPGETWHSDGSCEDRPPMGSILHLRTAPESGGDTHFASMYAAYETLPEAFRRSLAGLQVINGTINARWYDEGKTLGGQPIGAHPLVREHPETGRSSLFVDPSFSKRVVGMDCKQGRELLERLFEHIGNPDLQVRFRWRRHSVAFWDNRCTLHRATFDYWPQVRSGVRVSIAGELPLAGA